MSGTEGGISDYSILNETGREAREPAGGSSGWGTLGAALGSGGETTASPGTATGGIAFAKGELLGGQTINALAQARQRVVEAQQAETAAKQLEDPDTQTKLGLQPAEASLMAAYARGGAKPEEITALGQGFQHIRNRAVLSDPNADPNARAAAAQGEAPETAAPKAQGPLGSVFRGTAMSPQGLGATSVSPLQAQDAQSTIGKNNAEAAAATSNAASHKETADFATQANGGAGKPPPGMRWKIDPNTMDLALDNTGRPTAEPIPGIETKAEPSTAASIHSTVVNSIGNLANEAENIQHLGVTTTKGATGIAGHTPGILNTLKQNLGNELSDSDQQNYNTSTNQMGRFIGILDNNGRRMIPQTTADGITQNLSNVPANTESARLVHLGAVKQAVQAADDTLQASSASPQLKALSSKSRGRVEAAIPYEMGDAIDFGHSGKDGQTFQQFLDAKKNTAGPSGHPADIQALLNKYGGK